MSVNLTKGGNVNLTKIPGLTAATVALGWKARATDGAEFDLDASLFMLGANGKVRSDADFIFYGNKVSADGSIEHTGDDKVGSKDGATSADVEQIRIDLSKVPAAIERLAVVVTIYAAADRRQSFGQVSGAFMRVINDADGQEAAKYDLSEDYSTETGMVFGEIYRSAGDWKFRAVGQGYKGGLASLCQEYGISATAEKEG